MEVQALEIPDVKLIRPEKFGDSRGFFSEVWSRRGLADLGLDFDFVQDNHALSAEVGVVRGLHFQLPPYAQTKLVRVSRGAIFDVAVDLRRRSQTYGKWVGATVSAEAWNQVLVPAGFAHGYCTLEPNTEVLYKVTAPYAPQHDRGLRWNDPAIGVRWPLDPASAILSEKDARQPLLAELPVCFP